MTEEQLAKFDPVLLALMNELEDARQKALSETGGAEQAAIVTATKAELILRFCGGGPGEAFASEDTASPSPTRH